MIPKASNRNQKHAASWTLPFITQQRAAVNNIIGFYLFLPSHLLPNHWRPNKVATWMIPSGSSNLFHIHCFQWHSLLSCLYLSPSASGKVFVYIFLEGKTHYSPSILYASNRHHKGSPGSTRSTKSCWEAWTSQISNPERNPASNPDISPPRPLEMYYILRNSLVSSSCAFKMGITVD